MVPCLCTGFCSGSTWTFQWIHKIGLFLCWKSYRTIQKQYNLQVYHFDPLIYREILDLCPCEVPVRGWGGLICLERREAGDNLLELWEECREAPTSRRLEQLSILFIFIVIFFLAPAREGEHCGQDACPNHVHDCRQLTLSLGAEREVVVEGQRMMMRPDRRSRCQIDQFQRPQLRSSKQILPSIICGFFLCHQTCSMAM